MKLIFSLSKQNTELSKAEALSVLNIDKSKLFNGYLVVDYEFDKDDKESIKQIKRLAYTKSVYQFLFTSNKKKLIDDAKKFDWNTIYKENFCIRTKNSKSSYDKLIAPIVWDNLENNKIKPIVKLKDSKTEIHLIFIQDNIIVGKMLYQNKQNFKNRAPHKKPQLSPTSLNPRLARALINLSGVELGGKILDPFCGVGGILIEWGLLGGKIIGYDINKIELTKCKINIKYYDLKKYKLINEDALTIDKQYDYIVTDLPYGRNSKINKKLEHLYLEFLQVCENKIKPKRIVLGMPDFIDLKNIIKKTKYKIKYKFKYYIHKSLSKIIFVLE